METQELRGMLDTRISLYNCFLLIYHFCCSTSVTVGLTVKSNQMYRFKLLCLHESNRIKIIFWQIGKLVKTSASNPLIEDLRVRAG